MTNDVICALHGLPMSECTQIPHLEACTPRPPEFQATLDRLETKNRRLHRLGLPSWFDQPKEDQR